MKKNGTFWKKRVLKEMVSVAYNVGFMRGKHEEDCRKFGVSWMRNFN